MVLDMVFKTLEGLLVLVGHIGIKSSHTHSLFYGLLIIFSVSSSQLAFSFVQCSVISPYGAP